MAKGLHTVGDLVHLAGLPTAWMAVWSPKHSQTNRPEPEPSAETRLVALEPLSLQAEYQGHAFK